MSEQAGTHIPSEESILWFRDRFDVALKQLEDMVATKEPSAETGGMVKALRIVRNQLLPPVTGCVVTMFDPRMRAFIADERHVDGQEYSQKQFDVIIDGGGAVPITGPAPRPP